MIKKLLLTGFGPFAEHLENPTESLVKSFAGQELNGYEITSAVLSVEYENSVIELDKLIEDLNPDVIISLGLAADRDCLTPELIAVNYQHSETADNANIVKKFEKINTKSKESFFSTLPVERFLDALSKNNIPNKLSSTAGTYVCNTVMYYALRKIQQQKRHCLSGFIHIPEKMPQEQLNLAIASCINAL